MIPKKLWRILNKFVSIFENKISKNEIYSWVSELIFWLLTCFINFIILIYKILPILIPLLKLLTFYNLLYIFQRILLHQIIYRISLFSINGVKYSLLSSSISSLVRGVIDYFVLIACGTETGASLNAAAKSLFGGNRLSVSPSALPSTSRGS